MTKKQPAKRVGKLGLLRSPADYRTLFLERYVKVKSLPKAPASVDYSKAVPKWDMLGNDRMGNCAIVAPANQEFAWTANDSDSGGATQPTLDQIVNAYSAVSGYNPKTGENDNGCNLLDVMKFWKANGIGSSKINAYARVSSQLAGGPELVRQVIYAFGGCTLGLAMPARWSTLAPGQLWNAPTGRITRQFDQPGGWGGHAVEAIGYDSQGLKVVTWGYVQKMTWRALQLYAFEVWVGIGPSLWGPDKKSPAGFDAERLLSDAAGIK